MLGSHTDRRDVSGVIGFNQTDYKSDHQSACCRGAVRSGGSEVGVQEVDVDLAVSVALEAFEDGFYYVLVDRRQCASLDEQVVVGEDSTVTFLRLVPLAGG